MEAVWRAPVSVVVPKAARVRILHCREDATHEGSDRRTPVLCDHMSAASSGERMTKCAKDIVMASLVQSRSVRVSEGKVVSQYSADDRCQAGRPWR